MKKKRPARPRERGETVRQAILRYLEQGPMTARELSAAVHVRERDVIADLEHLERSLRRSGRRLAFEPSACLGCAYRFTQRRRLTRPSACPRCRGQQIEPPVFRLEPPG